MNPLKYALLSAFEHEKSILIDKKRICLLLENM